MSEINHPLQEDLQKHLEEKLSILKTCQNQKQKSSCLNCADILGCQIRQEYVEAVYKSMNSDGKGDFIF